MWADFLEEYKDEFDQESTLLGEDPGNRAVDDLRLRVIEHVCFTFPTHISPSLVSFLVQGGHVLKSCVGERSSS